MFNPAVGVEEEKDKEEKDKEEKRLCKICSKMTQLHKSRTKKEL
jgi:hypothetical protein